MTDGKNLLDKVLENPAEVKNSDWLTEGCAKTVIPVVKHGRIEGIATGYKNWFAAWPGAGKL